MDTDDDWHADSFDEATLPNPAGLHARPAATVASEAAKYDAEVRLIHHRGGSVPATTPIGLATLNARMGDDLRVEARGPQAAEAVAAIIAMIRGGFGEIDPNAQPPAAPAPAQPLGVSAGRVVGQVHKLTEPMTAPPEHDRVPANAVDAEIATLGGALSAVIDEYRRRAELSAPQAADILQATATLAGDSTLVDAAAGLIRARGMDAPNAFWQAANHVAQSMTDVGGMVAERAVDLADIRDRVVSHLLGIPMPGVVDPGHPFILVARDLAPSETATLDGNTCLAIVTAEGGPTSHTSILARSMGIPAVVGCSRALDIADGTVVLVDGRTGEVIEDPDEDQRAGARTSRAPLRPLEAPGRTADGTPVSLLANVGSGGNATFAARANAEGIGLFRTEFCFLDRAVEPSVSDQVQAYSEVLGAFPGAHVVVRTLDAGSDKPMAFLPMPEEPNPALGVRGYRTSRTHQPMLERQLDAIVTASTASGTDGWVMAPMISTAAEAHDFAALARSRGVTTVGVMIETPSAALQAADILSEVDFVSIGTNDLTQYCMGVDRQAVGLGDLQDPWQPGVLRLLKIIGDAGRASGKPVGVCGEAAADPTLAPVLIGLGVSSLSMSPRSLQSVAEALSEVTVEQCRAAADAAVAATTASGARDAVRAALA
ncbi:phosphoenolpyruvate--protein phosphotransferase [Tessaracoccus antarcticus]|uniref:phosphoenolpyruvate--protein phosphotransferase n=1 Tax=Tessaracoccus antarcticus TaxID=2479848 RepID=UPI002D78BF9D|nr:phosphoenolpyruvate--protein phosphotransferase [Tessaracoccus antarcticus]